MTKTTIEISTDEYENLCEDSLFLSALEAAGVDNWRGYGEAFKIFEEMKGAND